jgi:hypothetical protein
MAEKKRYPNHRTTDKRYLGRSADEIPYPSEKKCSKCGQVKPAEAFWKKRRFRDGLDGRCAECRSAEQRAFYHANLERERERARTFARENAEKLRASPANGRNRYKTDSAFRQAAIDRARRRAGENPEAVKAWRTAYREAFPEKWRAWSNAYRARKVGAEGDCTVDEWLAILRYFDFRCAYCLKHTDEVGTLAREHMLPLSRGGTNHPDNLAPSCKVCNSRKRNSTPLEFLVRQRRLECLAA